MWGSQSWLQAGFQPASVVGQTLWSGGPLGRVPLDPLGERSAPLEFLHARDLLRRGAREIDMMLNIARLRSRQF